MIQDNIEEPLTMNVTCGKSVNVYFEVIRKASLPPMIFLHMGLNKEW